MQVNPQALGELFGYVFVFLTLNLLLTAITIVRAGRILREIKKQRG